MTYYDALTEAMTTLGREPKAIFLGQGVTLNGNQLSDSLAGVSRSKRLEFPVAEELQLGTALGLALQGFLPICIFPRWNFMLRAADQLVNHLDRLPIYSAGGYKPRVIIRTAVPSTTPFDPQSQHDDDFSEPFDRMLRTVKVVRLREPWMVTKLYAEAAAHAGSSIMVEYGSKYRE